MNKVYINCLCSNKIEAEDTTKIVCKKCYRIWERKYIGNGMYDWLVDESKMKIEKLFGENNE